MAAKTRPAEELYDSEADPWEVKNLIDDPAQSERVAQLRSALDGWIQETGDLGFVLPETRLVREHIWPPDGVQPQTPPATIQVAKQDGRVIARIACPDAGASIGYRLKKKGPWAVYTGPFSVPGEGELQVRTHRIGHKPSTTSHSWQALEEAPQSTKRPPNILFLLVDDLGYMDIGANNPDALYDTPNIDGLAASGVRFTSGYAACPVCSPTRYSLMTGRYPTRAGTTNWFAGRRAERFRPAKFNDRMELGEITLAEAFKEHGYATFFAGKWHLGPSADYWPERQGFDINRGGFSRGGPYGPGKYFVPYGNPRLEDGPEGEHLPDRLASETCAFMAANKDRPFLAYLSFYSVHTPLIGREDLIAKYRKRLESLRQEGEQEFGEEEQVFRTKRPRKVRILQRHATYAAMVEAMDLAVGKVLKKLDELGLTENTIVVFTSDNGGLSTSEGSPTSNLPLRGGKGWLYEGGIREPWLVRMPGVTKAGTVCDVPISSIDALPTLLDLAGPARSAARDRRSELRVAPAGRDQRGRRCAARPPALLALPPLRQPGRLPRRCRSARPWKLLERFEDGRVHLYDLANDPGERQDLAAGDPDRVRDLRQLLHGFYRRHDARFLRARPGGPAPWRPR